MGTDLKQLSLEDAPIPRRMWDKGHYNVDCYWCGRPPAEIGKPDCLDYMGSVEAVRKGCPLYNIVRGIRLSEGDDDETE